LTVQSNPVLIRWRERGIDEVKEGVKPDLTAIPDKSHQASATPMPQIRLKHLNDARSPSLT
jgi:hypothetical protein